MWGRSARICRIIRVQELWGPISRKIRTPSFHACFMVA